MIVVTGTLPDAARGQGESLGLVRRLEGGGILLGKVLRPTLEGVTSIQIGGQILQLVLPELLSPGTSVRVRGEAGKILVEVRDPADARPPASAPTQTPGNSPSVLTTLNPTPLSRLLVPGASLVVRADAGTLILDADLPVASAPESPAAAPPQGVRLVDISVASAPESPAATPGAKPGTPPPGASPLPPTLSQGSVLVIRMEASGGGSGLPQSSPTSPPATVTPQPTLPPTAPTLPLSGVVVLRAEGGRVVIETVEGAQSKPPAPVPPASAPPQVTLTALRADAVPGATPTSTPESAPPGSVLVVRTEGGRVLIQTLGPSIVPPTGAGPPPPVTAPQPAAQGTPPPQGAPPSGQPTLPATPEAVLLLRPEGGQVVLEAVRTHAPQPGLPPALPPGLGIRAATTLPSRIPSQAAPPSGILLGESAAPAQVGAESSDAAPHPTTQNPLSTPSFGAASFTQVLVKVLQAHSLPAQMETLQILHTALGNVPPEQAPALALLLARNVPITPENIVAVREKLRARGNLGRELGQLSTEITRFLATGSVRGSDRLAGLLVQIQDALAWNQTGDLGERVERLRDFLHTFEEKLLAARPEKARSDLKAMVLELDSLLAQAELPRTHPLRAGAERVLNLIEGAQLSGLSQVGQPDKEAWVFWRIPFPGDPSPTSVELAVRGERDPDRPERYNPRDLEILLQVELSALGPVRVRLRSLFEQIRIILSVAQPIHREFLVKEVPVLVESLRGVGFDQVQAEVRVEAITPGALADELDPLRDWERRLEGSPPSFDIRL